jgi:acyl phosphate:glycerol-3-phosphate acyltransferase
VPLLSTLGVLLFSYLLGSIPSGLIIVRWMTGKDVRQVESGRTGGTNAMRAAGIWAGLLTAILDLLKGASTVWIVRWMISRDFLPQIHWLEVLAPVMAVFGHNYSIFLVERNGKGRLRFRGGAGGAPTVGGAMGLWAPSLLVILPAGMVILLGLGYASVTTLSVGLIATLLFAYRAWLGISPWQYVFYGVMTLILMAWTLRPNIQRLLNGTERVVGWRARRKVKQGNPVN